MQKFIGLENFGPYTLLLIEVNENSLALALTDTQIQRLEGAGVNYVTGEPTGKGAKGHQLIGLERARPIDLLHVQIKKEKILLQITERQSKAVRAAGIEIITNQPPRPDQKKDQKKEPKKEPTKVNKDQVNSAKLFIEGATTLKNKIRLYLKGETGGNLAALGARAKKMLEFTLELFRENLNPKIYIENNTLYWDYETGRAKIYLEPWAQNILLPRVQQIAASFGQMVYLPKAV